MTHPSDRHYRLLIGTAAFVIIAAGIREAAELLNSILLAMLLTVTVVPAFDTLRRRGVPTGLAVVLTSLFLAGVLVVLVGALGLSSRWSGPWSPSSWPSCPTSAASCP